MKIKHLVLALFLVFMCVVTLNTAEEASAVTTPTLSVAKYLYAQNENVVFNFTNGGGDHGANLYLYRKDLDNKTVWTQYYNVSGQTTYTIAFGATGRYEALVQAYDSSGSNPMSTTITFYVGPVVDVKISAATGTNVIPGQTIKININSDDRQSTHILHVYDDPDDSLSPEYHTDNLRGLTGTSYTYTVPSNMKPGRYYFHLFTANGQGGTNSNKVYFTVFGGSLSVTSFADTSSSNGKTVYGTIKYTITVKNNANCSVNLNLTVSDGVNTVYSISNGSGKNGTGSASISGNIQGLAANTSVTITVSIPTGGSSYDGSKTYTVTLGTVTGSMVGLSSGSGSVSGSTSTSYTFKPARGSVSMDWSASKSGFIYGEYYYTVTFTNDTNHTITSIDYTIKIGNTEIVTVTNGTAYAKQTYVKVGSSKADQVSLGNVGSGGNVQLLVYINTTGMAGNKGYTFTLANGSCTSSGVVNAYDLYPDVTKTHAITVPGGSVTATVSGQPTTNGLIVAGDMDYTITITNGTNYEIKNISFKFGNKDVNILTVTNGVVQQSGYVKSAKNVANTLGAGKTMTITFTFNTSNLGGTGKYEFQVLNSSSANSTAFSVGSLTPTFNSTTHYYYVANGTLNTTVTQKNPGTNGAAISNGAIAAGNVVYTVSIKNNTNHQVNNVNVVVKIGGSTLVTIKNGSVSGTNHGSVVTVDGLSNISTINSGDTKSFTITVNASSGSLSRDTEYTVKAESGTCSASNLASGYSKTNVTINASSSNPYIRTNKGSVSISWAPSIDSGKVVEGKYTYVITFTNTSNHAIKGINFTLSEGSTPLVTVSGGSVTVNASNYVSVNKSTLGDSNKVLAAVNGEVTLEITIDTTKLSDGSSHTYTLSDATCNANGIQGGSSTYQLTANAGYTHSFTVRDGSISVTLGSATVNNKGVAEGDVVYTITLNNGTNHSLNNVVIVLKDSKGNALITVSGGKITINDPTLVTAGGTITDNINANGRNYVISGITVNGKADILDADGQLVLIVESSAVSSDVVGSDAAVAYAVNSNTYTVMVRHDVDLLVQAGKDTAITLDKIFAAMDKSGATVYEGITGITGIALSDINGGSASVHGMSISDGKLSVNLSAEYTEFIVKATYNGGEILVPMQITTLSAGEDKTFVLDYGLPVHFNHAQMIPDLRLTGGSFPSITNTVAGYAAAYGDQAAASLKGKFGTLTYVNETFTYTTNAFLNSDDVAYVVVLVGDNQSGKVENVDYVNVYKKISFIPANVIYYEDTLGNIVYPPYDLTIIGPVKDPGITGNQKLPSVGNLGFDDGSYANSKDVTLSGQSVHKVPVTQEQKTISFTFTGTGFELISRVNAFDAATIIVKVKAPGNDYFDWYPVITSFNPSNVPGSTCEVYQVPVFRLNEDTYNKHGVYEVEIVGLPMQDYDTEGKPIEGSFKPSYIYVDGIRVYNPLGNSELTENYGDEKDAQFHNIRDLILAGKGTLADYTDTVSGFVTGEHHYYVTTDNNWSADFGGINELGAIGANNEIFVRRSEGNYIVVLRVKEDTEGAGLLQIGIRDVHEARFDGNGGENVGTTVSYNTTGGWTPLVTNTYSGTEQYYSIDLSKCPTSDGYKVVVLRVDSGFASFTNIKHKNLTFGEIGEAAKKIYTEPNFFFNESGDICSKDEEGNVTVLAPGKDLFELDMINGIMAQSDANNDLV